MGLYMAVYGMLLCGMTREVPLIELRLKVEEQRSSILHGSCAFSPMLQYKSLQIKTSLILGSF